MNPNHLLYGFHPVHEALRHRPHEVVRVWVAGSRQGGRRSQIEGLCSRHRVPVAPAPADLLASLGEAVHNGFVAELREPDPGRGRVRTGAGDEGLEVLLEDVQDPRNLGALLRVCEGAGVARVSIRDRGSAPLSPLAAKTSAGASQWLAIERITNSGQEIEALKQQGYWVYGADAGGTPAWDLDLTGKVLLCFGGEEKGLRSRTRSLCDALISVPMRGRVTSLNVATAAAAVLYEAVRQRERLHAKGRGATLPAAR